MREKNTATKKLEEASNFLKDKSSLKYLLIIFTGIVMTMKDSIKIAIAGATGYVGIELVKILSKHPYAKICYLCAQKSIGMQIYKFDK